MVLTAESIEKCKEFVFTELCREAPREIALPEFTHDQEQWAVSLERPRVSQAGKHGQVLWD